MRHDEANTLHIFVLDDDATKYRGLIRHVQSSGVPYTVDVFRDTIPLMERLDTFLRERPQAACALISDIGVDFTGVSPEVAYAAPYGIGLAVQFARDFSRKVRQAGGCHVGVVFSSYTTSMNAHACALFEQHQPDIPVTRMSISCAEYFDPSLGLLLRFFDDQLGQRALPVERTAQQEMDMLGEQAARIGALLEQGHQAEIACAPNLASILFTESCGRPVSGHVAFSWDDVARHRSERKASVLILPAITPQDHPHLAAEGLLGVVSCAPEAPGHLPVILQDYGLSGVINATVSGAFNQLAARLSSQDRITLDPQTHRLLLGPAQIRDPLLSHQFQSQAIQVCTEGSDVRGGVHGLPQIWHNLSSYGLLMTDLPIGLARSEHLLMEMDGGRELLRECLLGGSHVGWGWSRFDGDKASELFGKMMQCVLTCENPYMKFRLLDVKPREVLDCDEYAEYAKRHGNSDAGLTEIQTALHQQQIAALVRVAADQKYSPLPSLIIPDLRDYSECQQVERFFLGQVRRYNLERHRLHGVQIIPMIESQEACAKIESIAGKVKSLCFGSNDLTQDVLGVPRHDYARRAAYMEQRGMGRDMYSILYPEVAGLLRQTMARARAVNPDIHITLCGAHASDPESVLDLGSRGPDALSVAPTAVNRHILPLRLRQKAIQDRLVALQMGQ
jgi:hypothetical protein